MMRRSLMLIDFSVQQDFDKPDLKTEGPEAAAEGPCWSRATAHMFGIAWVPPFMIAQVEGRMSARDHHLWGNAVVWTLGKV